MSRSARSAVKTKQPNEELYEEVEMQHHYVTNNNPQAQHIVANSPPSDLTTKLNVTTKLGRKSVIALIVAFLGCVLIVSLVAVVMYSPLVQGSTGPAQQESATAIQQPNENNTSHESLQEALTSVQDKLANYDAAINTLNIVQARLANYETTVNTRLANYDTTINTLHNSLQSVSSLQNTLSQNVDRLSAFDLYQGCFEETQSCTMSGSTSSYGSCGTGYININPRDTTYFTTSVLCDYSYTGYFSSYTFRRSGTSIQCYCRDTAPYSGGHNTFSRSGTCTLTVTKCPRSQTVT